MKTSLTVDKNYRLNRIINNTEVRTLSSTFSFQPQLPEEEATLFDKISNFATRKLYELLQFIPEYLAGRIIVAAFIIDRGKCLQGTWERNSAQRSFTSSRHLSSTIRQLFFATYS